MNLITISTVGSKTSTCKLLTTVMTMMHILLGFPNTHSCSCKEYTTDLHVLSENLTNEKEKVAKPYPVIGNVNSQCVVKMIHNLHKLFTLKKQGLHL